MALIPIPMDGAVITVQFPDGDDPPLVWTFDSQLLPGATWERLLQEHPAKVAGMDYDPASFPPAVLVASITGWQVHKGDEQLAAEDRAPTLDEATELWTTWPQGARIALFRPLELQNLTSGNLGKVLRRASERAAPGSADIS